MMERLFGGRRLDEATARRLPPGQYLTEKFPVLHYGSVPNVDPARWQLRVWGQVESELLLTWAEFQQLPRTKVHADIHCVTRWTMLDATFEGVPVSEVLRRAGVRAGATHALAHCEQGYTTNLPLDALEDDDVLLADSYDGRPLEPEHGGPLRLLVPKRYFWKSAKWIRSLELLDHDEPGFWERYGYHNDGDPWKEERFAE